VPLRSRAVALVVAAIGVAGCGGDDGGGEPSAPVTAGERDAVAQLKYCFEGAGALTAKPGAEIAELDRAPGAPQADDAKRVLVVYWADTAHAAHLYYSADADAAEQAADQLATDGLEHKGNVIAVPDEEEPPSSDEALLVSDCLP
jgi:hypothetical protein